MAFNLLNNIGVFKTLQKWDFSDSSGRHSIVLLLEPDLFESHSLSRNFIDSFVYHTVCALTQLVELLVPVDLWCGLDELGLLTLGSPAWSGPLLPCRRLSRHYTWLRLLSSNVSTCLRSTTCGAWDISIVLFHSNLKWVMSDVDRCCLKFLFMILLLLLLVVILWMFIL